MALVIAADPASICAEAAVTPCRVIGRERDLEQVHPLPDRGRRGAQIGDEMASASLIDPAAYADFIATTDSRPSRADIVACASEIDRHPGIVVGRLHDTGVLAYGRHRDLLGEARRCLSAWNDRSLPAV
jgi:hypothetical protein